MPLSREEKNAVYVAMVRDRVRLREYLEIVLNRI